MVVSQSHPFWRGTSAGFRMSIGIMENQMEKNMENEMETEVIQGYILVPVTPITYSFMGYTYY